MATHGSIFVARISMWRHNRTPQTGKCGGKSDALAVVPTRRSDDPFQIGLRFFEFRHVNQAAAYFECTNWSMVLMLYPNFRANAFTEQRPTDLRSRRDHLVYKVGRRL
jgi:hypothetical protein